MGRRAAILATALATAVVFASVVEASTAAPVLSVEAAEANLQGSIGVRRAAEQRVATLEQTQRSLQAQIATASSETAAVTSQLAAAREKARLRAVDAYVNGGTATQLMAFIRSDEIDDASARTAVLSSQTHSAVEAADAFQKLKDENDPKAVALAERLHSASRELTDARSDLLQADAQQADAEMAVAAAKTRAQDEAAAKAAAKAAASQKSSTQRSTAPARRSLPPTAQPVGPALTGMDAAWAALRKCESGGNYQVVSSSGRYRGAYQFNQSTWDSVAATVLPEYVGVDPAQAPPSVQDTMAQALYDQRGSRPWPHCGRHLP